MHHLSNKDFSQKTPGIKKQIQFNQPTSGAYLHKGFYCLSTWYIVFNTKLKGKGIKIHIAVQFIPEELHSVSWAMPMKTSNWAQLCNQG